MTAPETLAERLAKCVKPLAWEFTITTYGHKIAPGNFEERPSCEFWDAETILMRGPYRIIRLVDDRISRPGPELYRLDIGRRELKFPTLEAAQAAAQADHTASILAALDMDAIARLIAEAVEKEREAAYRDGFAAAVEVVRTMRTHYSWGPKATADYGVQCERQAILGALEANAAAIRARAAQTEKEG